MTITSLKKSNAEIVREGPVRFTPAQALHIFNTCRYARNRNEKNAQSHISNLRRQMQRGTWLDRSPLDFARKPDGALTLVNGHHRLLAQAESGVDIVWQIIVHDVANDDEIASLFWRFDTTLRKRSIHNVLDGVQAADALGLSKSTTSKFAGAVRYIHTGMKARVKGNDGGLLPDEILELMSEWQSEALMYEECLSLAAVPLGKKMRAAQVFSVALLTFRAHAAKAVEFWSGLAADDGLRKGDPRKTLSDFFRDTHLASTGFTATSVACARAWNAYYDDRELSCIRVGKAAVRIAGTKVVVQA